MAESTQSQLESTSSAPASLVPAPLVPIKKYANPVPLRGLAKLYMNKKGADIHFTFGTNEKRIPAHKAILAQSSPVFDTQFYGSHPVDETIPINDVTTNEFEEFLQFFYLDEVELTMEAVQNVQRLAHRYQFDECLNQCTAFMMEHLSMAEVCLAYQLANLYEIDALQRFCQYQICARTEDVLTSESFLLCDWTTVMKIVGFPALNCNEVHVLAACLNWARSACERQRVDASCATNLRANLKGIALAIRFKSITLDEFRCHIHDLYDLYDKSEMCNIIKLVEHRKTAEISDPTDCSLSLEYRQKFHEVKHVCICSTESLKVPVFKANSGSPFNFNSASPYINSNSTINNPPSLPKIPVTEITFSSNKMLVLAGLSCEYSAFDVSHKTAVTKISFGCDTLKDVTFTGTILSVQFTDFLVVHPNEKYCIKLTRSNDYNFLRYSRDAATQTKINESLQIDFHNVSDKIPTIFKELYFHDL